MGDERLALWSERRVTRAAVGLACPTFHEPLRLEAIHEVGDPSARDEDASLHVAEEEGALVIENLEDTEFREGNVVSRDVGLQLRGDRVVGAGEDDPDPERALRTGRTIRSRDLAIVFVGAQRRGSSLLGYVAPALALVGVKSSLSPCDVPEVPGTSVAAANSTRPIQTTSAKSR